MGLFFIDREPKGHGFESRILHKSDFQLLSKLNKYKNGLWGTELMKNGFCPIIQLIVFPKRTCKEYSAYKRKMSIEPIFHFQLNIHKILHYSQKTTCC